MLVIRIQIFLQFCNQRGVSGLNSGLRFDWLSISLDGGLDTYKRLLDSSMELEVIPGLPMYPVGYGCDGYRLYLQDGESIRELIRKKEDRLSDGAMLSLSNAYPLGLLVFDHLVLWASDMDFVQSVIWGYEEMGCEHHVTRVDLNTLVDLDMKYFSDGTYKEHVRCRSDKGAMEWGNGRAETVYFGDKRARKRLLCRIYDKRKEVGVSKKLYMIDEFDEWKHVTSVEFELRRDGLKRWNINTISDLIDGVYRLWKRCCEWLKFENDGEVQEWWDEVRGVDMVKGITVVRTYEEKVIDIERLYRVLRGYVNTAMTYDERAMSRIIEMVEGCEKRDKDRRVRYETENFKCSIEGGRLERDKDIPF